MNISQSIQRKNNRNTQTCCIENMECLLDHIDGFSQFIESHDSLEDEQLQEELHLFKTYIKWKMEDLFEESYYYPLPSLKHNS